MPDLMQAIVERAAGLCRPVLQMVLKEDEAMVVVVTRNQPTWWAAGSGEREPALLGGARHGAAQCGHELFGLFRPPRNS
jgi:hypothetical protein